MIYMLYILCCYISLSFLHQLCYRRERVHFLSNWFPRFRKQSMFVMFQCVFRNFLLFSISILLTPFLERRWFAGSVCLICYDTGKKICKELLEQGENICFCKYQKHYIASAQKLIHTKFILLNKSFFCRYKCYNPMYLPQKFVFGLAKWHIWK